MTRYLAATALALLVLPISTLRAQESDDEWLSNCRDDSGNWGNWGSRVRHCEIRETGMKATGGPLTIDPGMNGGVEIIGWNNSDSIAITARIQINARSSSDAEGCRNGRRDIGTAGPLTPVNDRVGVAKLAVDLRVDMVEMTLALLHRAKELRL